MNKTMKRQTAAEIEAAAKAKAAKQERQERRDNAKEAAANRQEYFERRKEKTAEVREEFAPLLFANVEVIKGRKVPLGTKAVCVLLTASRHMAPLAMLKSKPDDKEPIWISPENLKFVSALKSAEKARYEGEITEEREATILVDGTANEVGENGVQIRHSGWFGRIFFSRNAVSKVGQTKDDLDIFEVPQWVIKRKIGQVGIDALMPRQAELEKLCK